MISLGVCIGSSNIGYVQTSIENGTPRILKSGSIIHEGNPERVIKELFTGKEFTGTTRLGVTGRKFRYFLDTPSISEPEAIECAYRSVKDRYPTDLIVSAGAETVMVYSLTKDGRIEDVTTGNKCASGTGEFCLQQLRRMDLAPRTWPVRRMSSTPSRSPAAAPSSARATAPTRSTRAYPRSTLSRVFPR
jgi:activator of 2-hydroxyglutaryl-CoA dehydratase